MTEEAFKELVGKKWEYAKASIYFFSIVGREEKLLALTDRDWNALAEKVSEKFDWIEAVIEPLEIEEEKKVEPYTLTWETFRNAVTGYLADESATFLGDLFKEDFREAPKGIVITIDKDGKVEAKTWWWLEEQDYDAFYLKKEEKMYIQIPRSALEGMDIIYVVKTEEPVDCLTTTYDRLRGGVKKVADAINGVSAPEVNAVYELNYGDHPTRKVILKAQER